MKNTEFNLTLTADEATILSTVLLAVAGQPISSARGLCSDISAKLKALGFPGHWEGKVEELVTGSITITGTIDEIKALPTFDQTTPEELRLLDLTDSWAEDDDLVDEDGNIRIEGDLI